MLLYSRQLGDSFAQDIVSSFLFTEQIYKAYNAHKLSQAQIEMVYEVFEGTDEIPLEKPVGEDGKYNEEAFYSYSRHLFDIWSIEEFFYKTMFWWFMKHRFPLNDAQKELIRYFLLWFFGSQNDNDEISQFGKYILNLLANSELFINGDLIEAKHTTVGVRIDFVKYNTSTHMFEPIDESDGISGWTWENSEGDSGICSVQTSEYGSRFVIGELPRKKDATLSIRMAINSDGMVLGSMNQSSSKSYGIETEFDEDTGDTILTITNYSAFVNIWSVFTFVKFQNLHILHVTENPEAGEYDLYDVSDYATETPAGWSKVWVDIDTAAKVIYHLLYQDDELTLPYTIEINNVNTSEDQIEDDMENETVIPDEELSNFGITLGALVANRSKVYDGGPFDYYESAEIHHVPMESTIIYHEDILQLEFRDFDIVPFYFDVLGTLNVLYNHGEYLPSYATRYPTFTQYLSSSQTDEEYSGWNKVVVNVDTVAHVTYDASTTMVIITNVNDTEDIPEPKLDVVFVDQTDPDDVPLKFDISCGKLTTNRNVTYDCQEGQYISEVDIEKIPCDSTIIFDSETNTLKFINFNIHV